MHIQTDSIISGEIITDSKSDVDEVVVQIWLLQMQLQQKQYGMIVIITQIIDDLDS